MSEPRETAALAIGAIVAVLLQVVVAPNIALASAMPNFVMAYVLVVSVARPGQAGPVLAFVLGLAFDLFGGGPVGAMAFLLVLASFLASKAFVVLDNDTLFMPLAILALSMIVIEMLYGTFLLGAGAATSVVDAFVYRALPCTLYDCVVGLVLYPLVTRFVVGQAQAQPAKPRLR